jgi:transcription antitermination factor NusG
MTLTIPYDAHSWFAVQAWAGREHLSSAGLRMRGYEVFLPTYRVNRRWSDRMKTTEQALFPGYLFCRVTGDEATSIITAPAVICIVGDGVKPLPVPEQEVASIRRIVDSHLALEPCPIPEVGQRVRVEVGPLAGVEGVVQRVKNKHRLVASIELLQRAVAVEIDPAGVSITNDRLFSAIRHRDSARRSHARSR